jgi:hypothetical protein
VKCRAKSKRTKQACGANAVTGRELCYHHGGRSLAGIAHPNYKDGRASRYMLPLRMRDDYQTALSDPKLLDLKPEIALVHARAQDLMNRVDSGESGNLWRLLRKAYADLVKAKDGEEQLAAVAEIGKLITRGAADYAAWAETMREIDRKQRLVESTRKRAMELHQMVTLDQLKPWLFDTIDFVRRYITDRAQLSEFQRILETRFGTDAAGTATATVVDREPAGDTPGAGPPL